jgi:plastocyanin
MVAPSIDIPMVWRIRMRGWTLLAGIGILAAGCGGSNSPSSPSTGGGTTVMVGNNFFSPVDLSVTPGTTVTWEWAANAVEHNVTFDDGEHSPTQSSGTFPRTFAAAGTFPYHCTIHGAVMHGTVTVSTAGMGGMGGTGGTGGGGGGGGGYP